MLDITHLEKSWSEYKEAVKNGGLTDWGLTNLACWMGERMGLVLAEVRRLREQIHELEKKHAALQSD